MDANMGAVNAVQKMLFDERKGVLLLLPALAERLTKGSVSGLCFTKGTVSMKWDLEKRKFQAKITFKREGEIKVRLPKAFKLAEITVNDGTYELNGPYIQIKGEKGTEVSIKCD